MPQNNQISKLERKKKELAGGGGGRGKGCYGKWAAMCTIHISSRDMSAWMKHVVTLGRLYFDGRFGWAEYCTCIYDSRGKKATMLSLWPPSSRGNPNGGETENHKLGQGERLMGFISFPALSRWGGDQECFYDDLGVVVVFLLYYCFVRTLLHTCV